MIEASRSAFAIAMMMLVSACAERGTQTAPDQAAGNANMAVPTSLADGRLSAYVGKFPSDAVNGTRFRDDPAVRAAVAASVPDAAIRDFVLASTGPETPIALRDGRVTAWGCERHNCGYHNWAIAITPDGASADVCFYHDDDSADGPATWYLADGTTEQRPGNCPSE
jgi:hypothetical protein